MTIRVTPVDGFSQWRGAYALDGSLNVTVTSGVTPVGLHAKDGSMNITVIPKNDGITRPLYARDGSMNVTLDPTYLSGPRLVEPASATYVLGPLIDTGYAHSNISVTRAGDTATYFDSTRTLQIASANTHRLDYHPETGVFRGLLVEPTSTNLIQRSNEFDNALWTKTTLDITNVGGLFTLTATGVNSILQRAETVTSGVALTGSFFVQRSVGSSAINTRVGDLSPTFVITPDSTLRRYERTATPTTTTGRLALIIAAAADELKVQYAQLEVGPVATSYIPNNGAVQNTRNADRYEITGSNFSNFWPATEGTVYFEFEVRSITAASTRMLFDTSNVAGTERVVAYIDTTGVVRYQVIAGGVSSVFQTPGSVVLGVNKFAAAFKLNDCQCALNGVASSVATSVAMPTGADAMGVGNSRNGTSQLNGWIKKLRVIPKRCTGTELGQMTS